MRIRPALAGAAVGAATMTLSALFAAPAFAATVGNPPVDPGKPTTCFQAQQNLATAQNELATARQNDAVEDSAITGAADFTPDTNDMWVTTAQGFVATQRGYVNALCGTTGTGSGNGFPRPIPGPVGLPTGGGVLTCAQLAAQGIYNIPAGNIYYRTYNDANHNGIACETGGNNGIPVGAIPVGTIQVVNGVKCNWNGTSWVPVPTTTTTTTVDPCNCTSQPSTIVVKPAPQVTQTVVQQAPQPQIVVDNQPPVTVPPAQIFTSPVAPTIGAVATGDGSLFGR